MNSQLERGDLVKIIGLAPCDVDSKNGINLIGRLFIIGMVHPVHRVVGGIEYTFLHGRSDTSRYIHEIYTGPYPSNPEGIAFFTRECLELVRKGSNSMSNTKPYNVRDSKGRFTPASKQEHKFKFEVVEHLDIKRPLLVDVVSVGISRITFARNLAEKMSKSEHAFDKPYGKAIPVLIERDSVNNALRITVVPRGTENSFIAGNNTIQCGVITPSKIKDMPKGHYKLVQGSDTVFVLE
jgi:hypothetical protein